MQESRNIQVILHEALSNLGTKNITLENVKKYASEKYNMDVSNVLQKLFEMKIITRSTLVKIRNGDAIENDVMTSKITRKIASSSKSKVESSEQQITAKITLPSTSSKTIPNKRNKKEENRKSVNSKIYDQKTSAEVKSKILKKTNNTDMKCSLDQKKLPGMDNKPEEI